MVTTQAARASTVRATVEKPVRAFVPDLTRHLYDRYYLSAASFPVSSRTGNLMDEIGGVLNRRSGDEEGTVELKTFGLSSLVAFGTLVMMFVTSLAWFTGAGIIFPTIVAWSAGYLRGGPNMNPPPALIPIPPR
jgi:hypothetical protein